MTITPRLALNHGSVKSEAGKLLPKKYDTSCFANKVLLEYSCAHLFNRCLWLLLQMSVVTKPK